MSNLDKVSEFAIEEVIIKEWDRSIKHFPKIIYVIFKFSAKSEYFMKGKQQPACDKEIANF